MKLKDKIEAILMKDTAFILLLAMASAAIFAATSLYITNGTGLTNEIAIGEMLKVGLDTGDYTGAASFAAAFLIARILEGPLVGILDIGGSLMTGVGVGIPALFLSFGWDFLIRNFSVALFTGFAIGAVIGLVIILIRKLAPSDTPMGAVAIMMGAGNKTGEALGPLVLISAISYSLPVGFGATIGSAIFYKFRKPIVGGAILGAMAVSVIMMMLGLNPVVTK